MTPLTSLPERQVRTWAAGKDAWNPQPLQQLAETSRRLQASLQEAAQFRAEAEQASATLSKAYQEISLLYAISQHLQHANNEQDFEDPALSWLHACLPTDAVAMLYRPETKAGAVAESKCGELEFRVHGECEVSAEQILAVVRRLGLSAASGPRLATRESTGDAFWPESQVQQMLIAPMSSVSETLGWVVAIKHAASDGFDEAAATLLNTFCSIMGAASGDQRPFRGQNSFLEAVVRSLTSAIDAKDPYTSGHSHRVARVAVRLGQELGCSEVELHTLYMGGLLHDIGKLGMEDQVLCKPGQLSDEEFEHIKQHPGLGFKILENIRELSGVLPIVLHHHEHWNGRGYPHGLDGENIPKLARITSVSDSFDAMTSDRTYRKGMPVERLDEIFREGAGDQWDATVIAAYFTAREDILEITGQQAALQRPTAARSVVVGEHLGDV